MSALINGKTWPDDFRTRFFLGMHTVDTDENATIPHLLRDMDGRLIVKQLADAGVDTVYFYASCHCGNCFYPTEVEHGHMHSGLNGRDVFGEAADEAQNLGVAFVGVYEFMHLRHIAFGPREWRHYYPTANPMARSKLCWNTGYGDVVEQQLEEIASRYPMAGVYVDMLDHPGLVCCEGCARRFKEDVGVPPPRVIDPQSTRYKVFKLWTFREEARYLKKLRGILQAHQPDATILNNYHVFQCEDLYELADANDYLSTDPGTTFCFRNGAVSQGSMMRVFGSLSRGKPPYEILHDPIVYRISTPEPYNAVTAVPVANGGASGYPSQMMTQYGTLSPHILAFTKQHSDFVKARDPWRAEGEPVRFAGLYVSEDTHLHYGGDQGFRDPAQARYFDEFNGACLMLQQEHVPFTVLTRRDLERLHEYPVVFLPNAVCMSDKEIEAFRRYVRGGGTLVSSYRTSLANEWGEERDDFGLGDVLGVRYQHRKIDPYQILDFVLPPGRYDTEPWESRRVSMRQSALLCALRDPAETLVPLHDLYRPDPDIPFSGLHNCYTREEPLAPGLVENHFGKGRSVYIAGKIFSSYLFNGFPSLRKLAARWPIEKLVKEHCLVRLDAPSCVEFTAWAQHDRRRLLLHMVTYQSAPGRVNPGSAFPLPEAMLPVHGVRVLTRFRPDQVTGATLQPAGRKLDVSEDDGRAVIDVPCLHLHDVVEVNLADNACPAYPDSNRVFDYPRHDLKAKIDEWLESAPPEVDPQDQGATDFSAWRTSEEFLIDWSVAGPFRALPEDGIDTPCEVEREPHQTSYRGPEHAASWQLLTGPELNRHGWIEMINRLSCGPREKGVIGYARCVLRSAAPQRARFRFGNNDRCKITLNGDVLYRQPEETGRGNAPDQVTFEGELSEGENTLLVKVENVGHGMGFFIRLEDLAAEVDCAPALGAEGRKTGSRSIRQEEWNGKGELQG